MFWIENVFFLLKKLRDFSIGIDILLPYSTMHSATVPMYIGKSVIIAYCLLNFLSSYLLRVRVLLARPFYLGPDDQNQQLFRNMLEKGGGQGGCRDVLEILDCFWNVDIWESNLARQILILHF